MYGSKRNVGRTPKFVETTEMKNIKETDSELAKKALEKLFSSNSKKEDESWKQAEASALIDEWESITPGKRFSDFRGDKDKYCIRVSTEASKGKKIQVRMTVILDQSIIEKIWGIPVSSYYVVVQFNKNNPHLIKMTKSIKDGFRLSKSGYGRYKLSFNTAISKKDFEPNKNSSYIKFEKNINSLILHTNEFLNSEE